MRLHCSKKIKAAVMARSTGEMVGDEVWDSGSKEITHGLQAMIRGMDFMLSIKEGH